MACVGRLILQKVVQAGELPADPRLQPGSPQVDSVACGRRRLCSGQSLARHQPHDLRQRRLVALRNAVESLAAIAVIQCGRQVGGDSGHLAGADGFAAGLLQRFEGRPGGITLRHQAAVNLGVVVAQAQGNGVSRSANLRDLEARQQTRWHRQPGAVAGDPRRLVTEADGDLALLGDGAHRCRGRTLENIDRMLVLNHPSVRRR